jgi:hypothetical protein
MGADDPSSYNELLADAIDATEGATSDLRQGGIMQAISGLHRALGRCEEILNLKGSGTGQAAFF